MYVLARRRRLEGGVLLARSVQHCDADDQLLGLVFLLQVLYDVIAIDVLFVAFVTAIQQSLKAHNYS